MLWTAHQPWSLEHNIYNDGGGAPNTLPNTNQNGVGMDAKSSKQAKGQTQVKQAQTWYQSMFETQVMAEERFENTSWMSGEQQ